MTAGVQNIDSAAYLPPPPSASSSTPDDKAASASGRTASDPQAAQRPGEPSEFQSELQQQDAGTQEARPAGLPKTGSGKTGKKQDTKRDDSNLSTIAPVQVAEPPKQILPFALTPPQPQEDAKLDENAQLDAAATADEQIQTSGISREPLQQDGPVLPVMVIGPRLAEAGQHAALKQPAPLKQSAALKQSAKLRQFVTSVEAPPIPAANAASSATSDFSKASLLASDLPLAPQLAVREAAPKSEDSSSQEQDPNPVSTSASPGASSDRQPVSRIELNLPVSPAEPVATAVHETVDSAPSSPSALAFAARMAAPPQKAGQPVATNAAQIPAAPGSQTPAQIPVRYAATAQIIPSAGAGTKEEGSKKDAAAAFGQSVRRDAHPDIRTDIVMPRTETISQASPAPAPAAPQQAASPTHLERIMNVPTPEPPAAPPTSAHDIRVRVPDSNGGSTQVRFVESGGEVRVSVRTADEGLAQNLRTHLNDLTQRLSDGGMPAEIWKPASNAASSQNDQHQPHQDGRGPGGQGSGGQGGQQDRQQKRPAWLEEMEASLHAE